MFFVLLMSRSQRMLPFPPIAETLGLWYKGMQHTDRRTIFGSWSSTSITAWKRIDNLYSQCLPTLNEKLRQIPRGHASFDNYNQILNAEYVVEGKSTNNQIGTAMLLREDQQYLLPIGTTMTSPRGLPFTVCRCAVSNDTP